MSDTKRINLFLPIDIHRQFKTFCSHRGATMQSILEGLVKQVMTPREPPRAAPPRAEDLDFEVCPGCYSTWPKGTTQCAKCGVQIG